MRLDRTCLPADFALMFARMAEFNADCEGDEVEIGFNNRYLLDALRNARTEKVRMEISGPLSPVKVLPAEGNDFLYLVLPVRFKND